MREGEGSCILTVGESFFLFGWVIDEMNVIQQLMVRDELEVFVGLAKFGGGRELEFGNGAKLVSGVNE